MDSTLCTLWFDGSQTMRRTKSPVPFRARANAIGRSGLGKDMEGSGRSLIGALRVHPDSRSPNPGPPEYEADHSATTVGRMLMYLYIHSFFLSKCSDHFCGEEVETRSRRLARHRSKDTPGYWLRLTETAEMTNERSSSLKNVLMRKEHANSLSSLCTRTVTAASLNERMGVSVQTCPPHCYQHNET